MCVRMCVCVTLLFGISGRPAYQYHPSSNSVGNVLLLCLNRKTSDLIPLCHPLPLDQVVVDIEMHGSTIFIECTCRVTHKTGVEMEALMGATVAALTIYDMVKAVSHQVEITGTRLVAKSGGKRRVEPMKRT